METFWKAFSQWSGIHFHQKAKRVLEGRQMPGARWFPGAKLNFAENLLGPTLKADANKIAIVSVSEMGPRVEVTHGELREQVGAWTAFLTNRGVTQGDRVGAITSNTPVPIVGMLGASSLGAIWSSCSPDFGVPGILDRFSQIQPSVLIAVDGYVYNQKRIDCTKRVRELMKQIPSVSTVIWVCQIGTARVENPDVEFLWEDVVQTPEPQDLSFASLPFDHPVYILFSSGTTGVPKCIVHGAGGTLLQHAKELKLHGNISQDSRFFYFTTCGWMMWNWLVSGLFTGCRLVLFDGCPSQPSLDRLWAFAQDERITHFGTSARFLGACRNEALVPKDRFSLSSMKVLFSTGSPLLAEDFDWVYESVNKDVLLSSIAGGTDIVSCFVLGNPMLPVVRGEIQCKGLGMAVEAWSDEGKPLVEEKGELVCTQPAPSMPVRFWNDPDGKKYRAAYFEHFPGVWRHGDYVKFTERGGCVMLGRSDATLNPSGVRIGTAEIYGQVDTMSEVAESLALGVSHEGDEKVVLFVKLNEGVSLDEALVKSIKGRIREGLTPRHVPWKVLAVTDIPHTKSGKRVEMAVAKVLRGEEVKNLEALANPEALEQFKNVKLAD